MLLNTKHCKKASCCHWWFAGPWWLKVDNKRKSYFKTGEEAEEKRDQFTLVGGFLVIAFAVPRAQCYACWVYNSRLHKFWCRLKDWRGISDERTKTEFSLHKKCMLIIIFFLSLLLVSRDSNGYMSLRLFDCFGPKKIKFEI